MRKVRLPRWNFRAKIRRSEHEVVESTSGENRPLDSSRAKFLRSAGASLTGTVAAFVVSLCATTAQGQLVIGNNAGSGGGPINTYNFATGTTVGSFVPTGAGDFNNGRGVEVVGDKVYYTELSLLCCATDVIRIAPFNGGAGGADIGSLPNPRPGAGIQDLAFSGGVLYALTGYNFLPLEVFGLNPITGAVVSGPVSVSPPGGGGFPGTSADGFTVLPNGNFLINNADESCTYNQYNPSTGALVPATTIVVPASMCTGVDTDGTSLFFQTDFNSITKTALDGAVIAVVPVDGPGSCIPERANCVEDISVQKFEVISVPVDVRPESCPNPLNTNDQGVLPVAILGTSTFDVTQVDVSTVKLAGVSPLRSDLEDVATPFSPFTGKSSCLADCNALGADGFIDLTLKFDAQAVVAALGTLTDGECVIVKLTGNLLPAFGGTPIAGEDVVIIRLK